MKNKKFYTPKKRPELYEPKKRKRLFEAQERRAFKELTEEDQKKFAESYFARLGKTIIKIITVIILILAVHRAFSQEAKATYELRTDTFLVIDYNTLDTMYWSMPNRVAVYPDSIKISFLSESWTINEFYETTRGKYKIWTHKSLQTQLLFLYKDEEMILLKVEGRRKGENYDRIFVFYRPHPWPD